MNETIGQVLAELKSRLFALYEGRLKGVYLFGSYARNEADEESDLDLLIVLDEVENYSREITRTSELISEVSLKYGISVSRFFSSKKQWRDDTTLFFVNLREEAISA